MFVTNWISTTKIQKISEITNFFRHYFLSRTEVTYVSYTSSQTTISVPLYTTIILCSCVFLMAEVTTSLSALNDNCFCP